MAPQWQNRYIMKYCKLLIFILVISSCESKQQKKELAKGHLQIDSINNSLVQSEKRLDSLTQLLKKKGQYYFVDDFDFALEITNSCSLIKGDDLIVEANIIVIPDSSLFFRAVAGELDTAKRYYKFGESYIKSITDTLFPTKHSDFQSIVINTPTINDTTGQNAIYYELFYESRNYKTIRGQVKYLYDIVE